MGSHSQDVRVLLESWKLSPTAVDKILNQGYDDLELLESLEPTAENLNALNFDRLVDKTMFINRWTAWKQEREHGHMKGHRNTPSLSTVTGPSSSSADEEPYASILNADAEIDLFFQKLSSDSERELDTPKCLGPNVAGTVRECKEGNPLSTLLKKNVYTKTLLNIKGRSLDISEWRLLSKTVIDHLIENCGIDKPPKLSYNDFKQWSEYLIQVFPQEKRGVWFSISPAVKGSDAAGARQSPHRSPSASGRLWQRYNNAKESWRKKNNAPRRAVASSNGESSTTEPTKKSRKRPLDKENEEDIVLDKGLLEEKLRVNADIQTIDSHTSIEVNAILIAAWKKTVDLRRKFMKTLPTVGDYLDRFPVLRNPKIASKLIEEEFNVLYPNVDTSALYKSLRSYAPFVIEKAETKYSRATKEQKKAQSAVKKLSFDDEQSKVTAALLLLPYCFFGGKIDDKGKKGSRLDAVSRFVYLVKTRSEGEEYLEKLKNELASNKGTGAKRCLGVQPFVIAIGENWTSIQSAFVIIDGFLYDCTTIIEAVDLCFKCMFVYDLSYPKESEHVWQIMQFAFYSLAYDPKLDKYIAGVQEFLAELEIALSETTETTGTSKPEQ